jgi:hypothetical protein
MSLLRCGKTRVVLASLVAMWLMLAVPRVQAQIWIASTGSVDEGSRSTYQFTGGTAHFRPSINAASVILRYNVQPFAAGVLRDPCCEGRSLIVRFRDNGSAAQVLVTLKRYNVRTGGVATLLRFDSNRFPAGSDFQEPLPQDCGSFFNFSFATGTVNGSEDNRGNHAYFIEATLIRTASGGNPGLATIGLITSLCP